MSYGACEFRAEACAWTSARKTFLRQLPVFRFRAGGGWGDDDYDRRRSAGQYAIQAYHDIKNDGHLDQGPFGLPREGLRLLE